MSDRVYITGVNIGNYASNANGYLRFQCRVKDVALADGTNRLMLWGQGGVEGKTIQSHADVIVEK